MPPRKSLAIDTTPQIGHPAVTEHAVQNAILAQLDRIGVFAWRQNTGAAIDPRTKKVIFFGIAGQGDITGILPNGRRLEIECKAFRGKISDAQRKFAEQMQRAGALYIVARDVRETIDIVKRAIAA